MLEIGDEPLLKITQPPRLSHRMGGGFEYSATYYIGSRFSPTATRDRNKGLQAPRPFPFHQKQPDPPLRFLFETKPADLVVLFYAIQTVPCHHWRTYTVPSIIRLAVLAPPRPAAKLAVLPHNIRVHGHHAAGMADANAAAGISGMPRVFR